MQKIRKILRAVFKKNWTLLLTDGHSQVEAQLKLRTEVENCSVLVGLVSTSGLQMTSSTSKTFQNAIISCQAFWVND